jgi:hypothetical protein
MAPVGGHETVLFGVALDHGHLVAGLRMTDELDLDPELVRPEVRSRCILRSAVTFEKRPRRRLGLLCRVRPVLDTHGFVVAGMVPPSDVAYRHDVRSGPP